MAKKAIRKAAKKTAKKKAAKKTAKKKKTSKAASKAKAKKTSKKVTKKAASKAAPKAAKSTKKRLTKSPLTKSQLKAFRQLLLDKRRDLVGDMNGIQAEALRSGEHSIGSDLSNMPTHPADIGTDNYEHEFSLGLLESERALLKEIDEALERVEGRIFGICLGTGEPIALPRLKARPWAKYGIEYARLLEKGLVRAIDAQEAHLDDDADLDDEADALDED
ncbi:MAG: TraR/DksA family transcriptional regulator [Planctomycetota bacterium]